MTTQLQAKDRYGDNRRTLVAIDGPTQADIDWLTQFCKDNLNVNPSFTVVLRAALSHYRSHLMAQPALIKDLDDLSDFIMEHRDLMFYVSGRPEKASDARYETN